MLEDIDMIVMEETDIEENEEEKEKRFYHSKMFWVVASIMYAIGLIVKYYPSTFDYLYNM